ncbi:MAG: hypothetical protein ABFD02_14345 [Bacteroidales bacterium]
MKKNEFNELSTQEIQVLNGGSMVGPPVSEYISSDSIAKANQMIGKALTDAWDYVRGFGRGFFNLN